MSSEHIETRKKIEDIPSVSTFDNLLDSSTLSEEDKHIMRLHYIEDRDFSYIGEELGYSESWLKKRHRKMLKKLRKLI